MKYLILLVVQVLSLVAKAGYFFEPAVGYKSETIKLTDLTNSMTEIKASQPCIGLKLGYRSLIGIDVNLAGEFTSGQAGVSTQIEKNKFTHATGSFQLGVNALGLVKMYLGTSFLNEFTLEDSATLQGFKLSGPSYQAGLIFKIFQMVHLGVQYNLHQFNTITGPAFAADSRLETYYLKNDTQDYSIYISTTF